MSEPALLGRNVGRCFCWDKGWGGSAWPRRQESAQVTFDKGDVWIGIFAVLKGGLALHRASSPYGDGRDCTVAGGTAYLFILATGKTMVGRNIMRRIIVRPAGVGNLTLFSRYHPLRDLNPQSSD